MALVTSLITDYKIDAKGKLCQHMRDVKISEFPVIPSNAVDGRVSVPSTVRLRGSTARVRQPYDGIVHSVHGWPIDTVCNLSWYTCMLMQSCHSQAVVFLFPHGPQTLRFSRGNMALSIVRNWWHIGSYHKEIYLRWEDQVEDNYELQSGQLDVFHVIVIFWVFVC